MDREIVSIARVNVCSYIRTDEEALIKEDSCVLGIRIWGRSFSMEMMEMEVSDVTCVCPAAKCLDKAVRDAGYAAEVDVGVRWDVAYSLVG